MAPIDFEDLKEQIEKAFTRALRYLSYRPRSEKEVQDYLLKKEVDSEIISQVIQRLREKNFLNDIDFVKWWVEQRQEFKGLSNFVIKNELLQKGVEKEVIENVLQEIGNDLKTAKELFEKKKKRFEKFHGLEYEKKVREYLQRKGFSWDIIQKILKESK